MAHFQERKKLGPMGVFWGSPGAPFGMKSKCKFYICIKLFQMVPNESCSKDITLGVILFELGIYGSGPHLTMTCWREVVGYFMQNSRKYHKVFAHKKVLLYL